MGILHYIKQLFQSIPSVSTDELQALLRKESITLIDVRTGSEFRNGHIKQAKNIPLNRIGSYTADTSTSVYVICQSGARSAAAARKLRAKGYDAVNVRGGMSAWTGPKTK